MCCKRTKPGNGIDTFALFPSANGASMPNPNDGLFIGRSLNILIQLSLIVDNGDSGVEVFGPVVGDEIVKPVAADPVDEPLDADGLMSNIALS